MIIYRFNKLTEEKCYVLFFYLKNENKICVNKAKGRELMSSYCTVEQVCNTHLYNSVRISHHKSVVTVVLLVGGSGGQWLNLKMVGKILLWRYWTCSSLVLSFSNSKYGICKRTGWDHLGNLGKFLISSGRELRTNIRREDNYFPWMSRLDDKLINVSYYDNKADKDSVMNLIWAYDTDKKIQSDWLTLTEA